MARTKRGNPALRSLRADLRTHMTEPERILWSRLRSRQFFGLKFRRQHGVNDFIVDFFCPEKRVAIEIDGDTHATEEQEHLDRVREHFMKALGVRTVRYNNHDVVKNIQGVMEDLGQKLGIHPSTSPNPSLQRRGM